MILRQCERWYGAYHNSPVVEQRETKGRAKGVGQSTGDVLVEHHKEQNAAFPVVSIHPPLRRVHKPVGNSKLVTSMQGSI